MTDRALIASIEQASTRAWPPAETALLSGWRLRYGGAHSRRLNSVQTAHFNGTDITAAIAEAATWYAVRNMPACFHIADIREPAGLDAMLAQSGYGQITPTSVMVADPAGITAASAADVQLLTQATPEVLQAVCDTEWSAETRRERVALFARIEPTHRFALATVDGQSAAGGMCVLEGDLAGIFCMRTQPAFRRRGLAAAILGRLTEWARGAGAHRVYLQVEDHNAVALRLYRGVGFARVYGYHYRERSTPG